MIHPFFHSDELKARGKKLIFIPYGIPFGGVSNDAMRLQTGAMNSDYIFVNNEEERQGVIESWKKVGIDMTDRCYAFGSPKWDLLDKDYDMPCEWKEKICKKVTLICTSIVTFNRDPKGSLEKYRNKIWDELSNGRMVIFRPHPLMEENIISKCPEYLDDWNELLEWAEHDCIVDYDELVEKTIKFSDKLISDPSSIVEVWKPTGKEYEVM